MSTWSTTILSLWAAYWAAMFAQVAHLRTLDDGVGATGFAWLSGALLAAGTGFFANSIGA
ncbi:hypothetical protein [Methylobacterium haplocladii]|uniref:Uncharacterized protein n=2 Tax=Methylobacterium haplocladii TaxID=1176176 RepID=A0A512IK93_9HYPH|nr:hypothetical protein [Methylobacterium haplocladii]GEO98143.1 hypothetical protein MHA02_05310 [Methylobacterium haplocladii]GJD83611.1 hypothetical protein HPGCJGGD_1481 [Methylobacterium haplocladii]GLS60338.1 hypothetical protein GCM10007887_30170 [Methylobacterium haplocladii]